ncbi:hypothetical protein K1X76_10630 [bacterium]|nr:hypothetical protein [bacterium]
MGSPDLPIYPESPTDDFIYENEFSYPESSTSEEPPVTQSTDVDIYIAPPNECIDSSLEEVSADKAVTEPVVLQADMGPLSLLGFVGPAAQYWMREGFKGSFNLESLLKMRPGDGFRLMPSLPAAARFIVTKSAPGVLVGLGLLAGGPAPLFFAPPKPDWSAMENEGRTMADLQDVGINSYKFREVFIGFTTEDGDVLTEDDFRHLMSLVTNSHITFQEQGLDAAYAGFNRRIPALQAREVPDEVWVLAWTWIEKLHPEFETITTDEGENVGDVLERLYELPVMDNPFNPPPLPVEEEDENGPQIMKPLDNPSEPPQPIRVIPKPVSKPKEESEEPPVVPMMSADNDDPVDDAAVVGDNEGAYDVSLEEEALYRLEIALRALKVAGMRLRGDSLSDVLSEELDVLTLQAEHLPPGDTTVWTVTGPLSPPDLERAIEVTTQLFARVISGTEPERSLSDKQREDIFIATASQVFTALDSIRNDLNVDIVDLPVSLQVLAEELVEFYLENDQVLIAGEIAERVSVISQGSWISRAYHLYQTQEDLEAAHDAFVLLMSDVTEGKQTAVSAAVHELAEIVSCFLEGARFTFDTSEFVVQLKTLFEAAWDSGDYNALIDIMESVGVLEGQLPQDNLTFSRLNPVTSRERYTVHILMAYMIGQELKTGHANTADILSQVEFHLQAAAELRDADTERVINPISPGSDLSRMYRTVVRLYPTTNPSGEISPREAFHILWLHVFMPLSPIPNDEVGVPLTPAQLAAALQETDPYAGDTITGGGAAVRIPAHQVALVKAWQAFIRGDNSVEAARELAVATINYFNAGVLRDRASDQVLDAPVKTEELNESDLVAIKLLELIIDRARNNSSSPRFQFLQDVVGDDERERVIAVLEFAVTVLQDAADAQGAGYANEDVVGIEEVEDLMAGLIGVRDVLQGKNIEAAVPAKQEDDALNDSIRTFLQTRDSLTIDELRWIAGVWGQYLDNTLAIINVGRDLQGKPPLLFPTQADIKTLVDDQIDQGLGNDDVVGSSFLGVTLDVVAPQELDPFSYIVPQGVLDDHVHYQVWVALQDLRVITLVLEGKITEGLDEQMATLDQRLLMAEKSDASGHPLEDVEELLGVRLLAQTSRRIVDALSGNAAEYERYVEALKKVCERGLIKAVYELEMAVGDGSLPNGYVIPQQTIDLVLDVVNRLRQLGLISDADVVAETFANLKQDKSLNSLFEQK